MPVPLPYPDDLPIVAEKEKIIKAIRDHQVIIVAGDTGSGKTTQLPKMCLEAGRGVEGLIGCTQPRRLAATAMAARLAEELEPVGGRELVGCKIRFHDRTRPENRIRFMTDGILLAEIHGRKKLSSYDTLIIDEAHERSLNIDFLLGYIKNILTERTDLKLIITSATIDTEKFSNHFNGAPVITVSGRTYPVEVRYIPRDGSDDDATPAELAFRAVKTLRFHERPGDILIFMPTERDIRETVEILSGATGSGNIETKGRWSPSPLILPLFGRLHSRDQQRIFQQANTEKIVVATNVAESSITVPGIRYVIDTGLARISQYNPRARTTSLPVSPISQASCDQRKGRCGRVAPGICLRLFSEEEYAKRPEYTLPEIRRSDLAEVILRMSALGLGDPSRFPFIDPPTSRAIHDGYALLAELGAIHPASRRKTLTRRGRMMARLPLEPRLSRQIIEASERNALREINIITAALAIQDPRVRPADHEKEADQAHAAFAAPGSDFLFYLSLWQAFHHVVEKTQSGGRTRKFCKANFLSYQRMREWQDIHEQITGLVKREGFTINSQPASSDDIHQAIISGFLRNIAIRKEKNIYQGAQGKEVMIFPGSHQFNRAGGWIVAAEQVETSRLFARTVATIKPEWLEPLAGDLCRRSYSSPRWEKKSGQVVADEKITLFGLVIVANRKRNFSRTSAQANSEAHDIFIRSALMEYDLGGRYPFLDHNRELVTRISGMEDRVRSRDILVDDQELFDFYDTRLPGISDRKGLNQVIKEQGDHFLKMSEQDIVRSLPDGSHIDQFPEILVHGDLKLKLRYCFDPGQEEDGVTVSLPADIVGQVSPAIFDWLVPGLLPEKILFLIKGLPKAVRKKLVPVSETARQLARMVPLHQGPLVDALEKILLQKYQVRIERGQWPDPESLPAHLRARFQLEDRSGKIVATSRSLDDFSHEGTRKPGQGHATIIPSPMRQKWERDDITTWDFAELPSRIPITGKIEELIGFAYPALTGQGQSVSIRLIADQEEARLATRSGLLALYALHFPKQLTAVKKECRKFLATGKKDWALYAWINDPGSFQDQVYCFVTFELFDCRAGIIPTQDFFERKIATLSSSGVLAGTIRILDLIRQVLEQRALSFNFIHKFETSAPRANPDDKTRFFEYRKHLESILPPDFLHTSDLSRIQATFRYFKGLQVRIERAHAFPAKDVAKAARLAPFLGLMDLLPVDRSKLTAESQARILEFQDMLEEFRISLFSPEIKTIYPVSEKRLKEKWQEVLAVCPCSS